MKTIFRGKKITGVLSVLPEIECCFEDEMENAESIRVQRLKKIMGYGKRRRAKATTTMSDMFCFALQHAFEHEYLKKDDVGAIVVVTLSPDYFVPQIGNIIHGKFGFSEDVFSIDIAQGCAGYLTGLQQAFMMLDSFEDKKILVFCGEIFNRKNKKNEGKFVDPAFGGDAATLTIVENDKEAKDIYFNMYNDGSKRESLIIHAGGFKNPIVPPAELPTEEGDSCMPFYFVNMDGSNVFNFVQQKVPPMIDEILEYAGVGKDDVDWYLFHQPNKFMLEKLADKLNIPYEKLPMNIVELFGNSNGATVPINITYNLGEKAEENKYLCCLSGFGSGLTWSSMIIELGKLDFCKTIESNL